VLLLREWVLRPRDVPGLCCFPTPQASPPELPPVLVRMGLGDPPHRTASAGLPKKVAI
jgi:hypothetical protein